MHAEAPIVSERPPPINGIGGRKSPQNTLSANPATPPAV
jgi:hypothetical protein